MKKNGIGSSVTSIAYNNVLPDIIQTHILNHPVWCNITYLNIFQIFNLFIPFSINVDSSFVFCGTPCRLVWFVFVGIGSHLGSSRRWWFGFRHVAPRRVRVTPNSIFFNTSSCKDPCFKGCISRCAVKSSGVWEGTHPFTSRLPPGVTPNGISITRHPARIGQFVFGCRELWVGIGVLKSRLAWTVMFIVDVLSHNQIYGEDVILMGVKYATIPISNRTKQSE